MILIGGLVVCGVGEKCVIGSIEFRELDMPQKYSVPTGLPRLPLLVSRFLYVVELTVMLYGIWHLISAKDRRIMVCCNSRLVENLFRSAKCSLDWVIKVIHEFFWWSVSINCYIDAMLLDL